MATVQEIAARIAREGNGAPSPADYPTEAISRPHGSHQIQDEALPSLKPTRKVWATAIAGVLASVSAYASQKFGYELDASGTTLVTWLLMSIVGYFTPDKKTS